ncbi:long-chain fatty acid--CoA ligase [[Bacillus] enclensis]|jgi:fatty-acyl-CoA synthase|uniref:Fatty-acyl-CoA synthase n=2 Tax=Rossellomorea TaxID=2837508 RepID=A0A0V8HHV1_9BACI|nr:AMP-binding protein [[Bacillus] enclensis]QTC42066.1 AMP-binding protein [Bacillus sp. V3]QWC24134.1 AMP-binding protein [Bacillus haikouensis]KSU62174.1 long-chain fatty acid--CoA ligase [[Bacillus] enclensis]MBH9966437.1 AMP-binding protein [[Bacillus] enclensis]SCC00347.1 fatty-acyl-CoA synthase [[Bacillus] enclensis]
MGMVTDWLQKRSIISPDRVALVNGATNEMITYRSLDARAAKWAYYMKEKGIKKGDRVVFICKNHPVCFELLFACSKIGAIFVPLNWRLSAAEIESLIGDCSPDLVFYQADFEHGFNAVLKGHRAERIDEAAEEAYNGVELVSEIIRDKDDPWVMIYTGGTTGKSKGVILSYRSINANALNTVISWNLTEEDATITYLPTFHTGGLNALSLPILMVGGKVVTSERFVPQQAIDMLNHHVCTIVLLVPTMYHDLLEEEDFEYASFPKMKVFLSGGAPCPGKVYDAFKAKGIHFKEGYGLTEAGPNNFYIDPGKMKKGSIGKSMMLNEVKVVDQEGKCVKYGDVGELLLGGDHLFKEYWNMPEETAAVLKDGWLHTGDLARIDHEGDYYIVGRKKDMIISGGENIYPQEIEHWLCEHPSISECAVVGMPHEKWGEVVTAFMKIREGRMMTGSEAKAYCLEKFGAFKIPKQYHFIDDIPKTDVGKVNKKRLVEGFLRTQ